MARAEETITGLRGPSETNLAEVEELARRARNHRLLVAVLQALVLIGFIALWQVATDLHWIRPFFVSQPTSIFHRLVKWFSTGFIYKHIRATLYETVVSFAVGVVLGIIFGFLLARSELLSEVFHPYVAVMNALPRVVLAPIFVLWFGLGSTSKIALGVSLVFFIVFYNTFQGVREADQRVIDKARMLGASEWQVIRHVQLPSAITWILSSLHTSFGFALAGVVVGEYLGATKGIGYLVALYEGNFDSTGVFSGMVVLAGLVLLIEFGIGPLERWLLRWQPRQEQPAREA